MKMTICEKCGCISYYDRYFHKYICSSCRHSQKKDEVGVVFKKEVPRKALAKV